MSDSKLNTLPWVLGNNFRDYPDRTALTIIQTNSPDYTITYSQLMRGSLAYTEAYLSKGLGPGDVIILVLKHGVDLVYSFFGAILLGAIPSIMPFLTEKLSPEKYQEDMASLIHITRPSAIVSYPEFSSSIKGLLTSDSSVRCVLSTDEISLYSWQDVDNLPVTKCSPESTVLLQHSSGTTGLQKGVALSHRAVLNQIESYSQAIHLTMGDVIISWLPLYHDMGLIAGFILPILTRVPLVLMSPFDWVRAPVRLFRAISSNHGTLCWLPNFAYNFTAQKIRNRDLEGVDLSSLRAIINCSEPMRWESHKMFLEKFSPYGLHPAALATCYAMAENVFAVTQGGIDEPVKVDEIDQLAWSMHKMALPSHEVGTTVKMLSAGRPISSTRVKIVNDRREDLTDRQIGEIALYSDCMLTGYYHRDDLTKKAFHQGWYLTGDIGYMVDGEVYVIGRKKDLIIVGGKNIYPQDLELLANQVQGVHAGRVVAFGVFNPEIGTEEVILVAETENQDEVERSRFANEIRQFVTQGSAIAVRHVEIVKPKWIIKTSSGKTARSANRDKFLAEFWPEYNQVPLNR